MDANFTLINDDFISEYQNDFGLDVIDKENKFADEYGNNVEYTLQTAKTSHVMISNKMMVFALNLARTVVRKIKHILYICKSNYFRIKPVVS